MEENILKCMLDDIFGDDIEEDAKESFIYFLLACGAYDEFIKHFDIKSFIAYKEIICDNDSYMAFYKIIPHSFSWRDTCHGFSFWHSMSKLHHMILYAKYKKKLIKANDRLAYIMEMDNGSFSEKIRNIEYDLNKSETKNKYIYMFISKLKDYFKEIGLK